MQTASANPASTAALGLNELILERTFLYSRLCDAGIFLVTELQSDLNPVAIQELEAERLLLNLILCAKHSMPFGGELLLSTSDVRISGKSYVRLLLKTQRNPPDGNTPCALHRRWDEKLSRKAMSTVVSSSGGTLAVCQETELVSFTEVLLPSLAADREPNDGASHVDFVPSLQ